LTFDLEVRLIWGQSRWTYTKLLFLLCRYIPFIYAWPHIQISLPSNLSDRECHVLFACTCWLWVIGIYFAQIILCVRTWAVWLQDRWVGIGLTTLVVGTAIVQCYYLVQVTGSSVRTITQPFPEFFGCALISRKGNLFYVCVGLVAFVDAVVVTLMLIRAFLTYKQGSSSKLSNAIHRDSIAFYVIFLFSTIINVGATTVLKIDLLILPQGVLQSVLTSRIILNIRDSSGQGEVTELHAELRIISNPTAQNTEAYGVELHITENFRDPAQTSH